MDRYVTVHVTVKLCILLDDSMEVSDVIDNMDYNFTADIGSEATIESTEILDHEVTDSK